MRATLPTGRQTRAPTGPLAGQLADGVRAFMARETSGAAVLLAATVAALAWANSPWGATYEEFWGLPLTLGVGGASLDLDLARGVNDGLMVFFVFVLGLEVKREVVVGELSDARRAAVPVIAALAGLVVPALVFVTVNPSGPAAAAWGVVISTDTAFALGVLALVGPRGSSQLRQFLLTLAVADDIGALAVVALFYTDDLAIGPLLLAVAGVAVMVALARRGHRGGPAVLRRGPVYLVLGAAVWVATVASGVHPTIAGVVIALFTPAFAPRRREVAQAASAVTAYRQDPGPRSAREARWSIDASIAPTDRLQLLYQPWTAFVIVPLFALANAGVVLDAGALRAAATSPLTWGVIAALVVGKLVGVLGGALVAVRTGAGGLAAGLDRWQLAGGAALSGIGFTISLLVVDLALGDEPALAEQARIGVLAAAVIAVVLASALLAAARRSGPARAGASTTLVPAVDPGRDHVQLTGDPADVEVTLVEFADFECPFCARASGSIDDVRAHFGPRLRYVFRHLPLVDVHPHAQMAARAAEAAGAQGKFWEMHDALFADQEHLDYSGLVARAREIGLDVQRFDDALDDHAIGARVREDISSAQASGARGTPTFFVDGELWTGATDAASLIAGLDAALDVRRDGATAPGTPATRTTTSTAPEERP